MEAGRHQQWANLAARLENYKETLKDTAKDKGLLAEFMAARSLTEAKRVLWGAKVKSTNCSGCSHKQTACACAGSKSNKNTR